MILSCDLINKGFSLSKVNNSDLLDYLLVKKKCYKKYVDEYFGGWIDDVQIEKNTTVFNNMNNQSCFQKILFNNETVGFLAYDEQEDKIDGISIQIIEKAQNKGVGSFYLNHITLLSKKNKNPIFLKVFKSNPAKNLYERFGFIIYDETFSHYLMKYVPKN